MTGKNIEIKARMTDLESVLSRIRAICKKKPVEIHQKDTFFHCTNGRIKLREFDDETGELIYYKRKNTSGPKLSEYHRYESKNPGELLASLTSAYGVLGVVQKKRILYLIGQTRVHVDHVKYLGEFVRT